MKLYLTTLLLLLGVQAAFSQKIAIEDAFNHAQQQTNVLLKEIEKAPKGANNDLVSPITVKDGELKLGRSSNWTSGFFPGNLWYLYEYTKDKKWLDQARNYTAKIENEKFNTGTHDLGFMIYCSFGNGYRLTGDKEYKEVIIQAAKSLSKRFDPAVGLIRSWDHHQDKWKYPVIIDNMMNLELLFEATRFSGDSSFYKIAISHADKTLKNHFRPDFSSYHVIDYDPETGAVLKKNTHQGYSHESSWARGQAWAVYGFILCYRETKNEAYLKQAEGIADYILKNLPEDMVPYWDYNDPKIPNVSRDASAAAITASALYELVSYSKNGKAYLKAANKTLQSLAQNYTNKASQNKGFILDHSTGNRPKNTEVDVPLNYADYYYLEALLRYRKL